MRQLAAELAERDAANDRAAEELARLQEQNRAVRAAEALQRTEQEEAQRFGAVSLPAA